VLDRRGFVGLSAAALASAISGCAISPEAASSYSPRLWEAVSPNNRIRFQLFGSIHLGYWRFYPLPAAIEAAWEKSNGLLVELETGKRYEQLLQDFAPVVRQAPGQTLEQEIGPELLERLRVALGASAQRMQSLQALRPWAVSLQLQGPSDRKLQADHRQGIDAYFLESAYRRKRTIIELESVQEQVSAFAAGSSEEQVRQLEARVTQIENLDSVLADLINAWRSGNAAELERLRDRYFPLHGPLRQLRQRMLVERDERMARRLLGYSHTLPEGQYFVVVGAFHLVGADNMLEQLARLGFSVRTV
jgi:uncharacterized protein